MAKRVRSWDDVYGHQNLVSYLKKHVAEDNIADVVIFHGSSGIGKSSIAKLLAIDITTRYEAPELKQRYIKSIIDENKSTDSIKLFNMSEIQEKEEEIQRVKAEFQLAFSETRRKVLILDEAHNMSRMAQDSVLTELEHLPKGVYVFICTTEIGSLREALQSRGKATFRLNGLSIVEARKFAAACIEERKLSFSTSNNMVVALVCDWAQNQPRKISNLFENFDVGSTVTAKELEVFVNVSTASEVIELVKYLYGSLTLGMDYLNAMVFTESFVTMLIEVCKVALGHNSSSMSVEEVRYIKNFMLDKDDSYLIKFTAEVAGLSELRKRRIISAFMRSHVSFKKGVEPMVMSAKHDEDLAVITENIISQDAIGVNKGVETVQSISELFEGAETLM